MLSDHDYVPGPAGCRPAGSTRGAGDPNRRMPDAIASCACWSAPRSTRASSGTAVRAFTKTCSSSRSHVSRKRVIRLMQEDGLKARARKRFKCTTMSDHDQPVAANLLDRQFTADAPNQRWVGDTTEFVIGEQRQAVSGGDPRSVLAIHRRLGRQRRQRPAPDDEGPRMALKRRCPDDRVCCITPIRAARTRAKTISGCSMRTGSSCSMSRRGNCYDNAVMEAFFSSVKSETAEHFDSCGEAKMELFDYIEVFYNQRRRHSTLGQISPAAFERRAARRGRGRHGKPHRTQFPTGPHPSSVSRKQERTTKNDQAQRNRPLNRIKPNQAAFVKGGGSTLFPEELELMRLDGEIAGLQCFTCNITRDRTRSRSPPRRPHDRRVVSAG